MWFVPSNVSSRATNRLFQKTKLYRAVPESTAPPTRRVEWSLRLRHNFAEGTGKKPPAACDMAPIGGGRGREQERMGMRYQLVIGSLEEMEAAQNVELGRGKDLLPTTHIWEVRRQRRRAMADDSLALT